MPILTLFMRILLFCLLFGIKITDDDIHQKGKALHPVSPFFIRCISIYSDTIISL